MAAPPVRKLLPAITVSLVLATGCSAGERAPAVAGPVSVHASETFPSSSISDWVSYPSELAVVTVTDERALQPEGILADLGHGYEGRAVGVRVDEVLWQDPRERDVPDAFQMTTWGWIVAPDGSRREARPEGSPRLTVGAQYVVPLTYADGRVGPLADHAVGRLEGGLVRIEADQRDAVLTAHDGRPVSELQQAVRGARPDPLAERKRHLPPADRARAVVQERSEAER